MSINTAIDRAHVPEVESVISLLSEYILRWQVAPTEERKRLIEAEAIALIDKALNRELEQYDVLAGNHPEATEIIANYESYKALLRMNAGKLAGLSDLFIKYFNTKQIALMEIIGQLKRVRQKYATLNLWSNANSKFVIGEHFLNWDRLGTNYQSLPVCNIDTNQGLLTLPIASKTSLPISSIRIGSKSNGTPGNSDTDVTTNNNNPYFAVNGQPENWFEYERLDSGPLDLTLIVEFPQEQIVNNIEIQPVNVGISSFYEIKDILFSTSNSETQSLSTLTAGQFDKDFLTVKTLGNDIAWNLTFLPVRVKTIAIQFKSTQGYPIQVATGDGRVVSRTRYVVGIKTLAFNKIQFEKEGGFNSLENPLAGALYACLPFAEVWPPTPDLFDLNLELSFDGGETWIAAENVDDGIGSTVLMEGVERSMLWRLRVARQDEAFANIDSFLPTSTLTKEIETLSTVVSRVQSPADISLPEKPLDNQVFAIQPGLTRRGAKHSGISLGVGTGTDISFSIPLDVVELDLVDDVAIYVNGREWTREVNRLLVASGTWAYSDDYTEIEFSQDLPDGAQVELVLLKELMLFEERSDGYYHKTKLLFDPDKRNINVAYLPSEALTKSIVLPRDRKFFSLGAKNILPDSLKYKSQNAVVYTEVFDIASVLSTADTYFIDYVNGYVRFNAPLDNDIVKFVFKYQSEINLKRDEFDIVYVDNVPWGIRIIKSAFASQDITETIGDPLLSTINVLTGEWNDRDNALDTSANTRTLSYQCIVKGSVSVSSDLLFSSLPPVEVSFVDGQTEFYGLKAISGEFTSEIDAGLDGLVEFRLSAGAYYHDALGIEFSNTNTFATRVGTLGAVNSLGEYYIATDGLVTVFVGVNQSLRAGIEINYYFKDPDFDPANKYSVDYSNGVLYAAVELNTAGTIKYKAACYKMGYDVAKQIDSIKYNQATNVVSVRTESLSPINSRVKLIWTKAIHQEDFDSIKSYFSPLLSVLGFRFS